jgi:flagellar basal-body rod protein FlgC
VFEPTQVGQGVTGVRMSGAKPDQTPFRTEYSPGNPAADAKGYVKLPNVDPLIEAMDMRDAQRAYEANLNVIETARTMDQRTLDLLKP